MYKYIGITSTIVLFVMGYFSRFFKISLWLIGLFILWSVIFVEIKDRQKTIDGFKRIYQVFMVFSIVGFLIFFAVEGMIISEMNAYPTQEPDLVVVLGAGLWGEDPSPILKNRLDAAITYCNENNYPIIVSGGQGSDEPISEAEAMRRYLVKGGIDFERIILENRSTSTQENILFSKVIIDGMFTDAQVLIITSDFHGYRAKYLAEKADLKVELLGTDTIFYLKVNYMLREALAVIKDIMTNGG